MTPGGFPIDLGAASSYWLRMLKVWALALILTASAAAVDPAVLVEQVEAHGFVYHAHVWANVSFGSDRPWRGGWLVLARREENGPFVALLMDVAESSYSVSSHSFLLPGIANQLRELLVLRSSTWHENRAVVLKKMDLTLDFEWEPGGNFSNSRYRICSAWGLFKNVQPGTRDSVRLNMAQVRDPFRKGFCSNLLIRAGAFFERVWK
jgi:hypothetical protein